jgi:hypothetical protein
MWRESSECEMAHKYSDVIATFPPPEFDVLSSLRMRRTHPSVSVRMKLVTMRLNGGVDQRVIEIVIRRIDRNKCVLRDEICAVAPGASEPFWRHFS